MKNLIKLNIGAFLIYFFIIITSNYFEANVFFRYIRSFTELFTILVLGGLNIFALISIKSKISLNKIETLSIASVSALIFIPLILTIEYDSLEILSSWLPIFNSFLMFVFLLIFKHTKNEQHHFSANVASKGLWCNKDFFYNLITSPLTWVAILYCLVIFIIFKAYYNLPDFDPYTWLSIYSDQFSKNQIASLFSDRPFFSSLTYIFTQSSHVDMYGYFKYVLPSLSILPLIPAWMIAKKFKSKIKQTLILLIPLASSSTILYSQTQMPQEIVIFLAYYFFFFLVYYHITKQKIFYYFSGIIALFSFFYQETGVIFIISWIIIYLYSERKNIAKFILKDKLHIALIFAIVFFLSPLLLKQLDFFMLFFRRITFYPLHLNFLFPAYYINIDGNDMGWSNMVGVLKYYIYYIGPVILLLLAASAFFFIFNDKFRVFIKKRIYDSSAFMIIFLNFLIFFSISELFPRFFNIAILPERSWIFGGIFSFGFIFLLFDFFEDRLKYFYLTLVLLTLVSIGGAIYINSLKKYVIPYDQLASARWIETNLPQDRFIFYYANNNLIKFHAQSEGIYVNQNFFCGKNLTSLKGITFSISKIYIESIPFLPKLNYSDLKQYIYYAKPDQRNPYIDRPYIKTSNVSCDNFVFDDYPEKFKRIYSDNDNIIIWEIL
jgi:hypothetical protein